MVTTTEEPRLFELTEDQVGAILDAMSGCDGTWSLQVRWGESWSIQKKHSCRLLRSDGSRRKGGVRGVAVGLFFDPETTDLGDLAAVSAICEFTYLKAAGTDKRSGALIDLSPLAGLNALKTLQLNNCERLTDLSALQGLPALKTLNLSVCTALTDLSPLQGLKMLKNLNLGVCTALTDLSPLREVEALVSLNLSACDALTDLSPLQGLQALKHLKMHWLDALPDLSPIQGLSALQSLDLSKCPAVPNLSPLQGLEALQELDLSECENLTDLSGLEGLQALESLKLSKCKALPDLSPIQGLPALQTLDMSACDALTDLSGLQGCLALQSLDLSYCKSLTDLSPIKGLRALQNLNLERPSRLRFRMRFGSSDPHRKPLTDISPLQGLQALQTLNLRDCNTLTDLSALQGLQALQTLDLRDCDTLTDLSPLQGMQALQTLNLTECTALSDLSALQGLPALRRLELSGCEALTDLSPLEALPALEHLNLNACKALPDVTGLRGLQGLKNLDLSYCIALTDVSPLQGLPALCRLNLSGCEALTDLSPLQGLLVLQSLDLNSCTALTCLTGLEGLQALQSLDLSFCKSLGDLSGLQGLQALHTLKLGDCTVLTDLSGLQGLQALKSLDLSDCSELADNRAWSPLESLPTLRELKGSFPSHFVTRLTARNAADRDDWPYAQKQLQAWQEVAAANSNVAGLLTAVGLAAALDPVGYPALVEVLGLAATHDAPDIDGLFATACPLAHDDAIAAALAKAVEQADQPLPPETLVALHHHLPTATTLRDKTLDALTRAAGRADAPDWAARTAHALREALNDTRYPVTYAVRDAAAHVLQSHPFGPLESALFGALCSDHARAADTDWRETFHRTLCGLALGQAGMETRNQALSDIVAGLVVSPDAGWERARLDALLQAAARVDPDTSALQAAVARAHATAGRWDAAEQAVFAVARPAIRDGCLMALTDQVLDTDLEDRARRAVALDTGLADPSQRTERLTALGAHQAVLGDPVAYGQLVALLAEHPEAQQQVIRNAVEARPALAEAQVPAETGPLTDRERALLARRDMVWTAAVQAEASSAMAAIQASIDLPVRPANAPVALREQAVADARDALWRETLEALDPDVARAAAERISEESA